VLSLERDTLSHGEALAAALAAFDPRHCLVLRAISAGASLFRYALHITPDQLTSRNAAVLNRLLPARRLHITTPGGTDLVITLDSRHRWISNRGTGRPGSVLILPAGEVATYPATIDGVFVADFAFNVNAITDLDARLSNHPVTVTIADSRAVDVTCADRATGQLLDTCLARHNADHIGELGFGTNRAVDDAIALNGKHGRGSQAGMFTAPEAASAIETGTVSLGRLWRCVAATC
jgi:leucyl aminopeptidase (aminopeptidase T)